MAITKTHELHGRRWGRNLGVALCLIGFAGLMFALTIVKISRGDPMQAFDHQFRPEMDRAVEASR